MSATLRYDPWGNLTTSTGASLPDWRWQASWFDTTTSLYWVVARWYAPSLGTFLSEDSLLGQTVDPGSRQLYAYGQGDPMDASDPQGTHRLKMGYASTWSDVAYYYYGTRTARDGLARANFTWPDRPIVATQTVFLPVEVWIGSTAIKHRVWGRDDPLYAHYGFAYGAPYISPLPQRLSPINCYNCYLPGRGSTVYPPAGAGRALYLAGWSAGIWVGAGVVNCSSYTFCIWTPVAFGATFKATAIAYDHGSLVTEWLDYNISGLTPPYCEYCATVLLANFDAYGSAVSRPASGLVYLFGAGGIGRKSQSYQLWSPPRVVEQFNAWIPRSAGYPTIVGVRGSLGISGVGPLNFSKSLRISLCTNASYWHSYVGTGFFAC